MRRKGVDSSRVGTWTSVQQRARRTDTDRVSHESVPRPVPKSELGGEERWARPLTITVDGPAGSGKSTLARLLAESIGFQFVDTGATYRALGWLALERDIPLDDAQRLRGLAVAQPVQLAWGDAEPGSVDAAGGGSGGADDTRGRWTVRIADVDVTDRIREPRIDEAASKIARHPEVRDILVARQRQLSLLRDTVLDGRDCGTNVRPDADLKLFITADFDERVRRRAGQAQGGAAGEVAEGIRSRDARDAPQSGAADDAVVIDTTDVGLDESLQSIVDAWLRRRRELLDGEVVADRTAREWIDNDFMGQFDRVERATRLLWTRGFRLEVHGKSRVPDEPCLFIANHASTWDPAFLVVPLHRPIRYMAKRELASTPIIKSLGNAIGMFPVRRGHGDRVAMHIGEEVLRRGDSMGIFPEGTRVLEGGLGRPRQGAARLALVTGVPIVPVAIHGSRWRDSLFKVRVSFGSPHRFEGRATPGNVAAATNAVWEDVEEMWNALHADRPF